MCLAKTSKRWIRRLALPIGVAAVLIVAASNARADEGVGFQVAFLDIEDAPLSASELAGERGTGIDQDTSSMSSGDQISVILWDEMSPRRTSESLTQSQVNTGTVSATLNGQPVY